MRKEPFSIGSYVHVMKRGAKKTPIVRDDHDRWRFLKLLRYLNDANVPRNWERDVTNDHIANNFARPEQWPAPKPYVSILAYCLMDNHFHLLIQEREEEGVGKFMQRLCTSMSSYFNTKYDESGTLFQGAYKARTVDKDDYLQHLAAYIMFKNTFERYPTGLGQAIKDFDSALLFAENYPFSSLRVFTRETSSSLLDMDEIDQLFTRGDAFLRSGKDALLGRYEDPRLDQIAMDL